MAKWDPLDVLRLDDTTAYHFSAMPHVQRIDNTRFLLVGGDRPETGNARVNVVQRVGSSLERVASLVTSGMRVSGQAFRGAEYLPSGDIFVVTQPGTTSSTFEYDYAHLRWDGTGLTQVGAQQRFIPNASGTVHLDSVSDGRLILSSESGGYGCWIVTFPGGAVSVSTRQTVGSLGLTGTLYWVVRTARTGADRAVIVGCSHVGSAPADFRLGFGWLNVGDTALTLTSSQVLGPVTGYDMSHHSGWGGDDAALTMWGIHQGSAGAADIYGVLARNDGSLTGLELVDGDAYRMLATVPSRTGTLYGIWPDGGVSNGAVARFDAAGNLVEEHRSILNLDAARPDMDETGTYIVSHRTVTSKTSYTAVLLGPLDTPLRRVQRDDEFASNAPRRLHAGSPGSFQRSNRHGSNVYL